jgi:hypothetical protein
MRARFEGGYFDGRVVEDWPDPPGTLVVVERIPNGTVSTWTPEAREPPPRMYRPETFDVYERCQHDGQTTTYHLLAGAVDADA